jgi:hypothetical protein
MALNGSASGLCTNRSHKGEGCQTNAECDTAPGSGDGKCKGRFVFFTPPLTAAQCTELAPVVVPLKEGPRGFKKASVALMTEAETTIPDGEKKPLTDGDTLQLGCLPETADGLTSAEDE